MCTLTYSLSNNQVVITSNRDEHRTRAAALAPAPMVLNGRNAWAPIDAVSGGSWLVVREDGWISVLLNGAENAHKKAPLYRKSRGLVLLELLESEELEKGWNSLNLSNIEPFTILHLGKNQVIRHRWNGIQKEQVFQDARQSHLWCSSTLFNPAQTEQRLHIFHTQMQTISSVNLAPAILALHLQPEEASHPGFRMNRSNDMLTKNLVQLVIDQGQMSMLFMDLINGETTTNHLPWS